MTERYPAEEEALVRMAHALREQQDAELAMRGAAHRLGENEARHASGLYANDMRAGPRVQAREYLEAAVAACRRRLEADAEHARLGGHRLVQPEIEESRTEAEVQRWTEHATHDLPPEPAPEDRVLPQEYADEDEDPAATHDRHMASIRRIIRAHHEESAPPADAAHREESGP